MSLLKSIGRVLVTGVGILLFTIYILMLLALLYIAFNLTFI